MRCTLGSPPTTPTSSTSDSRRANWPRPTRRGSRGAWSTRASAARTASHGRAASCSRSAAPRGGTRPTWCTVPRTSGRWRSGVPVVLTVHDLLAFRHPEYVPGAYSRVLRWMIRIAARRASRILTVSRASRDDIVRYLGVPAERVVVTPLAGSRPGGDDAAPVPAPVPARSSVARRRSSPSATGCRTRASRRCSRRSPASTPTSARASRSPAATATTRSRPPSTGSAWATGSTCAAG